MIEFAGEALLLDVEGTTSSVSYVVDVLFPFARRELYFYLRTNWNNPEVARAREQVAQDAGATSFEAWGGGAGLPPEYLFAQLREHLVQLMDADAKTTGLKMLQGLIWQDGYARGELKAHVYPDVPLALKAWTQANRRVAIYSSGSVLAQRLLFAHTEEGDLTSYISAYFDTTSGSKRAAASYTAIAHSLQAPPGQVLFLSDVQIELDAAKAAGLATALVCRADSDPCPDPVRHPVIGSFDEVRMV